MRKKMGECFKTGGSVDAPPAHVKKELAFMRNKGAPKSMIKAEKREHGLFGGGSISGKARLGKYNELEEESLGKKDAEAPPPLPPPPPPERTMSQHDFLYGSKKSKEPVKKMAAGGSIDGCATRGKTRGRQV